MEIVCELGQVSKKYDGRMVLNDVHMRVQKGEMVAITGSSGAGKTTLLNIMGLLERADSGCVRLFGEPAPRPGSYGATKLLRHRLAYLFQNFALIDDGTVDENLEIALLYSRRSRKEKEELKRAALERVGLNVPLKQKIYSLSGGEQQRVALARILLKPCDLILADEPTGSLDAENRDAVLDVLKQLRQSGKTVIIATHDAVVAAACDRVATLRAGCLHEENDTTSP